MSETEDELPAIRNDDRHLDIDIIADGLISNDDRVEQQEIFNHMFKGHRGATGHDLPPYESLPLRTVNLSDLERNYTKQRTSAACSMLSHRTRILIDPHLMVQPAEDQLVWSSERSAIDFMLCVGDRIGFDAVIPMETNRLWTVCISLRSPYRDFKCKYGRLGFDPAGRMLHLGQRDGEDIWLGMLPKSFLDGYDEDLPAAYNSGDTRMTARHYRQIVMVIALVLHRMQRRAFYCHDIYEIDLDSSSPQFENFTDVLEEAEIRLDFDEFEEFNDILVNQYEAIVNEAPVSWKGDGFLIENVPVGITCRYGQDSNAGLSRAREAAEFEKERRWVHIRSMDIALATDIKANLVEEWRAIPVDQILEENEEIFDGYDPDYRNPVDDLEELEMTNSSGEEVRIYNSSGHKIPRREALLDTDKPACGLLVKLDTVHALFENPLQDLEDSDTFQLRAYPMAFLHNVGHIQSNKVIATFDDGFTRINQNCYAAMSSADPNTFPPEQTDIVVEKPVVAGLSSQFYSELSHRSSHRAGGHDVQKGHITAALSGAWAAAQSAKRVAEQMRTRCEAELPHQRFKGKIDRAECPRELRCEHVYHVDVKSLSSVPAVGRFIYDEVILPLVDEWKRPAVFETLREHLLVFKPEVYPQLFLWVTYPITTLLEFAWNQESRKLLDQVRPCPYITELVCALERVLVYAHTGNTVVLHKPTMGGLFMLQGVLENGFPTIAAGVIRLHPGGTGRFSVNPQQWPLAKDCRVPAIGSHATQLHYFKKSQFLEYQALLFIDHQHYMPAPTFHPPVGDPETRRALQILGIAWRAYYEDVISLIRIGVEGDLSTLIDGQHPTKAQKRERLKLQRNWSKMPYILDHGTALDTLIRVVVTNPSQVINGLPGMEETGLSYGGIADDLWKMFAKTPPSIAAPAIAGKSFAPVMKAAIDHLNTKSNPPNGLSKKAFITKAIIMSMKRDKIHYIPWFPPSNGPGSPLRRPRWNWWAAINAPTLEGHVIFTPHLSDAEALLRASQTAQRRAQQADPNAEWAGATLDLKNLPGVLERLRLPMDFEFPLPLKDGYIRDTYEHCKAAFNAQNPVHRYAVLIGVVLAQCLPNIFFPDTTVANIQSAGAERSPDSILNYCQTTLPWVAHNKEKGLTDNSKHLAMFITFIIALYDDTSPLRRYMDANKGALGKEWCLKHSAKGVTIGNLARVGALVPLKATVFTNARHVSGYRLRSVTDIEKELKRLKTQFKADLHYGVGDFLIDILGYDKACEICSKEKQSFLCRRKVLSLEGPSSSKRSRKSGDLDSDEEEMEGSEAKRAHR